MHGTAYTFVVPGTVELRKDNSRTGRQADKEAYDEIDQCACAAADGCQRLLADELTYDDRIGSIIELLKEGSQKNGKEKSTFLSHRRSGCKLSA